MKLCRLARAAQNRVAMGVACWHKSMEPVHHTHPQCKTGQEARGKYERKGTGGKPLCSECARLGSRDAGSSAPGAGTSH